MTISVDLVPEQVLRAFKRKPSLSPAELAHAMGMDVKTLRRIVKTGRISYYKKGTGLKRPRRTFTLVDVVGYYSDNRERDECLSTVPESPNRKAEALHRRSSTTISGSAVADFTALRKRRLDGKPLT